MKKKKKIKEPWLGDPGASRVSSDKDLFFRKSIEQSPTGGFRVWRENPPLVFSKLGPDDLLDTGDLLRLFRCSLITLYRWIRTRGLAPSKRVGRELFFTKRDVQAWVKIKGRPKPGRPKVKGGE